MPSAQSEIRDIDPRKTVGDEGLLAEIGYKQELNRTFNTFQVFGIAYSIMGLLPSISSLTGTGLTAGPAGFLWSWFVSALFILSLGVSMSELASSEPTAGGLFYWTFYYAPRKHRVLISYVIGMSNSMALIAGSVSIAYGNAEEILAAVYLSKNGNFDITNGKTYGIFAACIVSQAICTCISSRHIALLQTISAVSNTGLIALFFIALPIGTMRNRGHFNDGSFIFGQVNNFSDWPIGFQFCLSMMTAVWTIGAFDSCVHMSEEARNASMSVPIGITSSISFCGLLGWLIIICTNACMNPDLDSILSTPSGFPMAQIISDSLGNKWAVAFMSLTAACQWLMGASILTALSRQVWAFARDDGLPFASWVKVINKKMKVPIRAVIFSCIIALLLGCLCLAGSAASSALFSLAVSGNYVSWCTPVLFRLTSGRKRFRPGTFYLGDRLSIINGWITIAWGAYIICLAMFPSSKVVDKSTMNYTVVITCGVWILSALYFILYKYKHYHGPKANISAEEALSIDGSAEVIPMSIDDKVE
ncbi:hypothetical protein FOA43_000056 [Brettanomyces nanus]|uniref:GABA-specific permease n=1 Tax=Eeniella nana TaxID=13502 RepID=A0A875RXL9_EENNA|nr:uncharacterized protein FOA43_000056 [Brettanomyces nanus]QPG72755.1 hypothetical protein FOA43_000056 [Brettanomyces nanus]